MSKLNTRIDHTRSFSREDLHLLSFALDIIRRFNADELAAILGGVRQSQNARTNKALRKLEGTHE